MIAPARCFQKLCKFSCRPQRLLFQTRCIFIYFYGSISCKIVYLSDCWFSGSEEVCCPCRYQRDAAMAANLNRRALYSIIPGPAQDLQTAFTCAVSEVIRVVDITMPFIEQYSYCPDHSTFETSLPVEQEDVLLSGYAFPTYHCQFSQSLFHRWMDGIVMEQGGTRCVTFPGMCHYNFLNSEITLRFSLHTIDVNGRRRPAPPAQARPAHPAVGRTGLASPQNRLGWQCQLKASKKLTGMHDMPQRP